MMNTNITKTERGTQCVGTVMHFVLYFTPEEFMGN